RPSMNSWTACRFNPIGKRWLALRARSTAFPGAVREPFHRILQHAPYAAFLAVLGRRRFGNAVGRTCRLRGSGLRRGNRSRRGNQPEACEEPGCFLLLHASRPTGDELIEPVVDEIEAPAQR